MIHLYGYLCDGTASPTLRLAPNTGTTCYQGHSHSHLQTQATSEDWESDKSCLACHARSFWGRESLLQTFLPFLWSHFQSFLQLHAGWNKYWCLTKAHKLTQNIQTNKKTTNQLITKHQKKNPWKTPNPTYWFFFLYKYPEQMMQCLCWPHASFILIEGEQKILTQA